MFSHYLKYYSSSRVNLLGRGIINRGMNTSNITTCSYVYVKSSVMEFTAGGTNTRQASLLPQLDCIFFLFTIRDCDPIYKWLFHGPFQKLFLFVFCFRDVPGDVVSRFTDGFLPSENSGNLGAWRVRNWRNAHRISKLDSTVSGTFTNSDGVG